MKHGRQLMDVRLNVAQVSEAMSAGEVTSWCWGQRVVKPEMAGPGGLLTHPVRSAVQPP